ncbi:TraB family protein [Nitzschia inconspicua]|uniref:TraB family protein n=1 Tax=Nitzschia inconspicua TaxID=303405 RepID=A0A9K3Q5B7_9STRA|nr:TraB family protein [Nitzschia inconspicua]
MGSTTPLSSSTSSNSDDTVVELSTPRNQKIILVGTGHMSRKSQEEVQAVIQQVQPNMVLVELDASRLPRIGIDGIQGIQVDRVVTAAEDILATSDEAEDTGFNLVAWWQRTFLVGFSKIARTWLTSMYDGMRDRQKLVQSKLDANEVIPGGEMLVAIRAAEQCPACDTVVLGDRSSVKTIQRAAQLAWDSGDALGLLRRLQSENQAVVKELRARVCVDLGLDDSNGITKEDEAVLEMEVMEALRNDSQVRDRLFQRLEERVPEFTQAFLKERDLIMGESIRRELEREGVERVVAVVGLAHVPGIRNILEASFASLPTTKSQ